MSHAPNVLLVVLDSVRAKNTSIHRYSRETTPFLEEFSEKATLYSQARSPGTYSITSHVSMFTNHHVEEHQAVENTAQINLEDTIWRQLSTDHGYTTGLFTPNPVISEASNLGDAFQTTKTASFSPLKYKNISRFEDGYDPFESEVREKHRHIYKSLSHPHPFKSLYNCVHAYTYPRFESLVNSVFEDEYHTHPGDTYISAFLDWQKGLKQPWAACINLLDAHVPFDPMDEYNLWADREYEKNTNSVLEENRWDKLQEAVDFYDATIRQCDGLVEKLMLKLRQRGALDDTMVIITSDHGLGFGESSLLYPEVKIARKKWGLHEVLTHVPLLVKYPGQTSGKTVDDVATLTNIPRTIKSVLADEDTDPLVDDGFAISSTRRLFERHKEAYKHVDFVDKCIGPWKAVYENTDSDTVLKYLTRHGDGVVVEISDAQTATVTEGNATETVEKYFSEMKSTNIEQGTNEISEELNEHLKSLGYAE